MEIIPDKKFVQSLFLRDLIYGLPYVATIIFSAFIIGPPLLSLSQACLEFSERNNLDLNTCVVDTNFFIQAAQFGYQNPFLYIVLVLSMYAAIAFILARVQSITFRCELGDHDLVVRYGVLAQQLRVIPHEDIVQVNLTQGLIDRFLKTSSLLLTYRNQDRPGFTLRLKLPNLSQPKAQEFYDELIKCSNL